jgi:hypothetical protein
MDGASRKDDLLARLRKTRSIKQQPQASLDELSGRRLPEERLREQDLVSFSSDLINVAKPQVT